MAALKYVLAEAIALVTPVRNVGRILILVALLIVGGVGPLHAAMLSFFEDLGNFPDAIEVGAEFGTFSNLSINGDTINATGFLFSVRNTSFGNNGASAFANDPDGDFADDDVLTQDAANAITNAQPFGIYSFGAALPGSIPQGLVTSAPSGFIFDREVDHGDPGFDEFNFKHIDGNKNVIPDGLIFDVAASGEIPSVFEDPILGAAFFFIETPPDFDIGSITQIRNDPGIDIATEMAWAKNGAIQTEFPFYDEELRPRGQLSPANPVPEPGTLLLLGSGLVGLGVGARRRTSQK